jgi:hypothetical protein
LEWWKDNGLLYILYSLKKSLRLLDSEIDIVDLR